MDFGLWSSSLRRVHELRRGMLAVAFFGCAVDQRDFPATFSGPDGGAASPDRGTAETSPESTAGQLTAPGNVAESGKVTASPAEIDLGARPIGEPTPAIEWTLTNGSSNALTGLRLTGEALPSFQVSNGCGDTLEPAQSCSIALVYVPRVVGDQAAAVTMSWEGGAIRLIARARGLPWLTVASLGEGRVTSTPPGIDCPGACRAAFDMDLEVTLTATPSGGARVADWIGFNCDGPVGSCTLQPPVYNQPPERAVEVRFFRPVNNLLFVSSESFSPVLGGTAPYDAACNRLATAAGINNSENTGYIAAISDSNSFFWDRLLPGVRGWQRMDGLPFADTITELVEFGIVYHSVSFDETGAGYGANQPGRPSLSGVMFDGTLGEHCSNWTSTAGTSMHWGLPSAQGPGGLLGSWELAVTQCDAVRDGSLTCLGNTSTAPLQRQISAGKRIWVTNTRVELGSMTPDEACQAQRPSGVALASALIASTRSAAGAVLDLESNYVRPDGTQVGSGADLVEALRPEPTRRLDTGIWQSADGTYLIEASQSVAAWTGATDLVSRGTVETTCNDWTTTNGEGLWGRIPFASEGLWSWAGPESCVTSNFFYCVEL
jgi:hypothetical protein